VQSCLPGISLAQICAYQELLTRPIAALVDLLLVSCEVNGLDASALVESTGDSSGGSCRNGTGAEESGRQSSLLDGRSNDLAAHGCAERSGDTLGGHYGSIEAVVRV